MPAMAGMTRGRLVSTECDRDFIQLVLRKDVFQITKRSQYFHSLIGRAARDVLIQNTTHYISPLGIAEDSVNIFLRRPGITYQQNMLQIVSFFPYGTQCLAHDDTEYGSQKNIQDIKNCHDGS